MVAAMVIRPTLNDPGQQSRPPLRQLHQAVTRQSMSGTLSIATSSLCDLENIVNDGKPPKRNNWLRVSLVLPMHLLKGFLDGFIA